MGLKYHPLPLVIEILYLLSTVVGRVLSACAHTETHPGDKYIVMGTHYTRQQQLPSVSTAPRSRSYYYCIVTVRFRIVLYCSEGCRCTRSFISDTRVYREMMYTIERYIIILDFTQLVCYNTKRRRRRRRRVRATYVYSCCPASAGTGKLYTCIPIRYNPAADIIIFGFVVKSLAGTWNIIIIPLLLRCIQVASRGCVFNSLSAHCIHVDV